MLRIRLLLTFDQVLFYCFNNALYAPVLSVFFSLYETQNQFAIALNSWNMNSWCLSDDIVDLVTVNVILVCNPVLSVNKMNKIGGPWYNDLIEDNIVCQEIK